MKKLHLPALAALFLALVATFAVATPASATTSGPAVVQAAVTPNITPGNCGNPNFVRVVSTFHGNVCYAGKGTLDPGLYINALDPGNNCGSATYNSHGINITRGFRPGVGFTTNDAHAYLWSLTITGWVGSGNGCN